MSICVFFICASGSWFLWKNSCCKDFRTGTVLIFCADLYELMMKHCTIWKGILLQTSWQKYLSGHWQYVITWRHGIWSHCDTHRELQNRVPYTLSKALPNLHFSWYAFRLGLVCLDKVSRTMCREEKGLIFAILFFTIPFKSSIGVCLFPRGEGGRDLSKVRL